MRDWPATRVVSPRRSHYTTAFSLSGLSHQQRGNDDDQPSHDGRVSAHELRRPDFIPSLADAQYRSWSIRFHIDRDIAINAALTGGESSPTNIAKYVEAMQRADAK